MAALFMITAICQSIWLADRRDHESRGPGVWGEEQDSGPPDTPHG